MDDSDSVRSIEIYKKEGVPSTTPTAAAESVAPSISELQMAFNDRVSRLAGATEALLLGHAQEIDGFSRRA